MPTPTSLRRHESDQIRFLPWVSGSDLEELLSNAALFVLPSEIEGLSLALLDAMAAGVCVLTSDIPENNEVVDGAGFTFHRGDQADLERMLDLLIHNPELRRQSAPGNANGSRTSISGPQSPAPSKEPITTCSAGARASACQVSRSLAYRWSPKEIRTGFTNGSGKDTASQAAEKL